MPFQVLLIERFSMEGLYVYDLKIARPSRVFTAVCKTREVTTQPDARQRQGTGIGEYSVMQEHHPKALCICDRSLIAGNVFCRGPTNLKE